MADGLQPNFSSASALAYGKLIETAYRMFDAAAGDPMPPPPPIDGYDFVAWVTMSDFVLTSGKPEFYGFLVESFAEPRRFIMAIRGTSSLTEWWDDLLSIGLAPWRGAGQVGYGFAQIYGTLALHVKDAPPPQPAAAAPAAAPIAPEPFARQVARAVHRRRVARTAPAAAPAVPAPIEVDVAGHSLGSALATLYVAENALLRQQAAAVDGLAIHTPLLYTFASPRVGDAAFATFFDALPVTAWRIVNELDLVPKVPVVGFQHVRERQLYNSGTQASWSLGCWHALNTYLHLIDASYPLANACQWAWARAGARLARDDAPDAEATLLPGSPPGPQPGGG